MPYAKVLTKTKKKMSSFCLLAKNETDLELPNALRVLLFYCTKSMRSIDVMDTLNTLKREIQILPQYDFGGNSRIRYETYEALMVSIV